jgi:hypothetical protein
MVDAQINVFGPNAVKQSMLIFSRVFLKFVNCKKAVKRYCSGQVASNGFLGKQWSGSEQLHATGRCKVETDSRRYLLFESDFLHSNTYICMHSTSR